MRSGFLVVVAAAFAPPAMAQAVGGFEAMEASAVPVSDSPVLESVVWAMTAACDQGDDIAKRQCRIVRDTRRAVLTDQIFSIDAEPASFVIGAWDAAKKSTPLALTGCVACAAPIAADGGPVVLVANKSAPKVEAGLVKTAPLHETAKAFPTAETAQAWQTEVGARIQARYLFRIPPGNPIWQREGTRGMAVQVVGFRAWDRCNGEILLASPASRAARADASACGEKTPIEPEPQAPEEQLPAQLTIVDIRRALRPAESIAQACFDKYGVAGEAKFKITIAGDGSITGLEQLGDFVDTPTGTCIEAAVRTVNFPRSKKPKTTVTYPLTLR